MSSQPGFFARPEGAPIHLKVSPRLASWNFAGHPDQLRLAAALDDAEALIGPALDELTGPLALRLDVGLASDSSLLAEHDLDNYALPLAHRLTRGQDVPLVSFWSTKAAAITSVIRCEAARPVLLPGPFDYRVTVQTSASASTRTYKQQVSKQLIDAVELPDGPVAMELAFVVGPRRNWLNLWKPTIDALDRLLGRTLPDREWHPRDGRVTQLGLHCTTDEALENDIVITIAARSLLATDEAS